MNNLKKCANNKTIFGVCCGISKFLSIEVSIVRLFFIFGTIFTGSVLLWVYLIMSLVLPKTDKEI